MCLKKDKQFQSYYIYYSSKRWGFSDSYDLSVNSCILGIEGTVNLLKQFILDFENREKLTGYKKQNQQQKETVK